MRVLPSRVPGWMCSGHHLPSDHASPLMTLCGTAVQRPISPAAADGNGSKAQPEWIRVPGPAPEPPKEAPTVWEGELQYSVRHGAVGTSDLTLATTVKDAKHM